MTRIIGTHSLPSDLFLLIGYAISEYKKYAIAKGTIMIKKICPINPKRDWPAEQHPGTRLGQGPKSAIDIQLQTARLVVTNQKNKTAINIENIPFPPVGLINSLNPILIDNKRI